MPREPNPLLDPKLEGGAMSKYLRDFIQEDHWHEEPDLNEMHRLIRDDQVRQFQALDRDQDDRNYLLDPSYEIRDQPSGNSGRLAR